MVACDHLNTMKIKVRIDGLKETVSHLEVAILIELVHFVCIAKQECPTHGVDIGFSRRLNSITLELRAEDSRDQIHAAE